MVSLELTLWDLPAEYARPLMSRTMFGSIILQEAPLSEDPRSCVNSDHNGRNCPITGDHSGISTRLSALSRSPDSTCTRTDVPYASWGKCAAWLARNSGQNGPACREPGGRMLSEFRSIVAANSPEYAPFQSRIRARQVDSGAPRGCWLFLRLAPGIFSQSRTPSQDGFSRFQIPT